MLWALRPKVLPSFPDEKRRQRRGAFRLAARWRRLRSPTQVAGVSASRAYAGTYHFFGGPVAEDCRCSDRQLMQVRAKIGEAPPRLSPLCGS